MTKTDAEKAGTEADKLADVLIVGAGISGLSAAWALARRGRKVVLLDARERIGGVIGTLREDGWQVETGPNTLMVKPPLYLLLQKLGLTESALFADRSSGRRYVLNRGRMQALPQGPFSALTNPLILPALPHLLREPWIGRGAEADESIASFADRRLGRHLREVLVDPFVSGVYGGDPERLSIRAAFPRLHALERDHGSLLRGAFAAMGAARKARASGPVLPRPWRHALVSFPGGLQELPDRLAEKFQAAGGQLCLAAPVREVTRGEDGLWQLRDGQGCLWQGRELILAAPAPVDAELLRPLDPALAEQLAGIVYAPMASVALGFEASAVGHPLDGFGLLLPHREGRRTLGTLFTSTLFPGRAPEGHRLITVFLGGRRDPEAPKLDDAALIAQAMADLGAPLGLSAPPVWHRVGRWPAAIPQYETGHVARLEKIDAALTRLPGLSLLGNWRDGIAVGDCLENGVKLADRLA